MTPHMVEEYVLETPERGASRIYHTRLTIYQRLANDEYLGELYVERDYKEGDNKGSTCRFECISCCTKQESFPELGIMISSQIEHAF